MSQFPVINAGTDMTAQIYNWMIPLVAIKSADQSVTNSTTLVNDTDLYVPVEANASYWIELHVLYEGGTQGSSDMIVGWGYPASSVFVNVSSTLAILPSGVLTLGAPGSYQAGTNGAGNVRPFWWRGLFIPSAAGTLQFKWAQHTPNATPTIVHADSVLMARRIA